MQRLVPRDTPSRRRREDRGRLRGDDKLEIVLRLIFNAGVVGDRYKPLIRRQDYRIAADAVIVGSVLELVIPVRPVGEGIIHGRRIFVRIFLHPVGAVLPASVDHRVFIGNVLRTVEYFINYAALVRNLKS